MSKQSPKDAYLGDGELPPPYSPEPSTSPSCAQTPPPSSSLHPDSLFAAHLASMRGQIREQQATRASLQDQHDTRLLALLVPHVEAMLAAVAALEPPPQLVQTTLVPEAAVTPDWTPAETYKERSREVHSVVRVQTRPSVKLASDEKLAAAAAGRGNGQEFDGWGRWGEQGSGAGTSEEEEQLWWKDENLARRLAKYLQPARRVIPVDRPTVAAKVTEAKKARSRWNILGGSRKGGSEGSTPLPLPAAAASRLGAALHVEDDVSMNVTAEEVTFRRENEMGIWESSTGWGVVVRVRIRG
ncbi:hypothetical protein LLEC1_06667 [Akanthomyces lecanii]|uniref:Uncharacterized protein n=1 Tax=Cordyceps confragosa TaxID=2714763 RepID=A0A179ID47_CORDF|nr:hypothetical protein LLEC1_06667 [Akanthomyces lecanii]